MKNRSCFFLSLLAVLFFSYPQMVSAEETTDSKGVNIQVDRLEGGPEKRSNFSTNSSDLFRLDDIDQIKEHQKQQQTEQKQQANSLFTESIEETTHDTVKKLNLFTPQSSTSSTGSATAEAVFQSLALASLTENNWFWAIVLLVLSTALLVSYQMYKRDKYARH